MNYNDHYQWNLNLCILSNNKFINFKSVNICIHQILISDSFGDNSIIFFKFSESGNQKFTLFRFFKIT